MWFEFQIPHIIHQRFHITHILCSNFQIPHIIKLIPDSRLTFCFQIPDSKLVKMRGCRGKCFASKLFMYVYICHTNILDYRVSVAIEAPTKEAFDAVTITEYMTIVMCFMLFMQETSACAGSSRTAESLFFSSYSWLP